ncbi:alpha/beta hydrolase [Marivibrio halodurans]|uniref:Alpha/beta hydrolase n=1 Tax=Marivibrio halodurans TaxID=2039722 RepID=A0A8J7S5N9_9PROT|nr:alpha/beta hydrolase [Marivibrio halodurans]MBP5857229.1 alpha/beta hydrolase [Marivibrio halodurans]
MLSPRPRLRRILSTPLALFGATLALAACSPLGALDTLVPKTGYRLLADVVYGDDPAMRFDLYLPQGREAGAVPTLVFFHGGSWRSGTKEGYRFIGQAFASRGLAVAVVGYRKFPAVRFPTFAADGARAVARLMEIAPDHGLSERVVLMGHSSGAHTAAAIALDPTFLEAAGVPPTARAGLIALSGPVSIDPMDYDKTRPVFAPVADTETRGRPLLHASADDPPTVLIHGVADDTVYPINSEKLAEALDARGVPVTLSLREGEGHIGPLLALSHPFEAGEDPLATRLADWVRGL